MSVRLYVWQRATAALMAPMVLVHLAVMFYATRQGLTAADILGRTRGSVVWAAFYAAFAAAAAVHAAIGIRNVMIEWLPVRARTAGYAAGLIGLALATLGLRAVAALVLG